MNLLKALINISKCEDYRLHGTSSDDFEQSAHVKGKPFEIFVKDAFCGVPGKIHAPERRKKYDDVFSFEGDVNHPPDVILRGGDAVEIKKIKGAYKRIHFNSSPPKSKLDSRSRMITDKCRNCENGWTIKDIIYAFGVLPTETLKMMFLVYGDCYSADNAVYEKPFEKIKSKISEVEGVITSGNEFGLLKDVDSIMRTDLRIRPMWMSDSPWRVFQNETQMEIKKQFVMSAIISRKKYDSFPRDDRMAIENSEITAKDVSVTDPNNDVNLLDAKLLSYMR